MSTSGIARPLGTSRTVRCPCGATSVKGTRSEIEACVRKRTSCITCGRRMVDRGPQKNGGAPIAFVRAHEVGGVDR
jgi:hypothetical protein